jgi:hypothetical protein
MKKEFNVFFQKHYRTDSNIPDFTYNNKNNFYNLSQTENQTINSNCNKEFEKFKTKISSQRNVNYKKNLFSNYDSLSYRRPNSTKKIHKTISFLNNENLMNKKYQKSLFFENNNFFNQKKIEKVIPGSKQIEEYKRNLENDLKLFKNYKPMKRYFISNLRDVPSVYERNYFSPTKNINSLKSYKI